MHDPDSLHQLETILNGKVCKILQIQNMMTRLSLSHHEQSVRLTELKTQNVKLGSTQNLTKEPCKRGVKFNQKKRLKKENWKKAILFTNISDKQF